MLLGSHFIVILYCLSAVNSQAITCLTKTATDPSSSANVPCTFPFTYAGKTYSTCTADGHPGQKSWCSTKVDGQGVHVEGKGHWGLCGKGCPQDKGCSSGWERLTTGCYRFENTDHGIAMADAKDVCEEFGGYLVEINSQEESDELQTFYETEVQDQCLYEADAFWIGVQNGTNGGWRTVREGGQLEYTNWYDTVNGRNVQNNEDCAAIFADNNLANDFATKNFKWMDLKCHKKKIPFFKKYNIKLRALCEKDVDPTAIVPKIKEKIPIIKDNGCLEGWTRLSTGCYLFKRHPSTFREAKDICDKAGGYVVEIDSEEEFSALEKEWKNDENKCKNNRLSWWIGITDEKEEGKWMLDYSNKDVEFSAWHEGEPNNWRGEVPGENCVITNVKDSFDWFDTNCAARGFPTGQASGLSFNPLCEQYSQEQRKYCEGCEDKWVEIGQSQYKFIRTSDGTTRDEAEKICKENGGYLADIRSKEERNALHKYYEGNLNKETSFFLSALNFITGNNDAVKYGWWIGATDELEEGKWKWKHSGENVTFFDWFDMKGNPRNENYISFGGADCSALVLKDYFLDVEFEIHEGEKKEIEEDNKWKNKLRKEEDFKWIDVSCYTRSIAPFHIAKANMLEFNTSVTPLGLMEASPPSSNIIMSPLCKMGSY